MDAKVTGKICDLFKEASLSRGCTGEAEAGGLNAPGHSGLLSKTLPQKTKQNKKLKLNKQNGIVVVVSCRRKRATDWVTDQ